LTRRPSGATSIHKVREMFAAVSLPLCDDGAAIQSAADAQRSARNRELNSTKGTTSVRAQAWFEQVDALLKKREQLLSGAYQDFVKLGDAVLGAAGFGGKRKVAKGGRRALLDLAQTWCGAREDLADYWVEQFMKERKLGTRPVGVGSRQKLTGLSHQPAQEDAAPKKRKQSSPTPPAVKKKKRKLQAPVASASPIALAEKSPPAASKQTSAPTQAAQGSAAKVTQPKKEGQQKSGSRRLFAIAGSALAVAAVLGAAAQGLIPLDFPGASASDAQATSTHTLLTLPIDATESQPTAAETTGSLAMEAPGDDDAKLPAISPGEEASVPEPVVDVSTPSSEPEGLPAAVDPAVDAVDPNPATLATPWTAWAIAPPTLAFAGQTLQLRLECDSLPDGRLHDLQLQGLKVRDIELTAAHTEIQFDVMPLPEDHFDGLATWSFTLKDEMGLASQPIQGQCQVLPPAR